MTCLPIHTLLILLSILSFVITGLPLNLENIKILSVGEELWEETLPLQMGSRLYQLQGLKSYTWYEVKISYPASIPASFSILLKKGNLDSGLNWKRKLLNTEKLIFKTDGLDLLGDQGGMYVLVTVEPEGIVAIPHERERPFIIFNIGPMNIAIRNLLVAVAVVLYGILMLLIFITVCDELLLGIPHKAWWVGVLVLLCLGLAVVIPFFLPSNLLRRNQSPQSNQNVSKDS